MHHRPRIGTAERFDNRSETAYGTRKEEVSAKDMKPSYEISYSVSRSSVTQPGTPVGDYVHID